MSVFGLIIAGRMVQTDFTALKEMEYMIEIQDAERFFSFFDLIFYLGPNVIFKNNFQKVCKISNTRF